VRLKVTGQSAAARNVENFRTRVARDKRHRTSVRLLEALFAIIDREGLDALTVDRIVREAGTSRGSFYNYFDTVEAMLVRVSASMWQQISLEQKPVFEEIDDVMVRLAAGLKHGTVRSGEDMACALILLRTLPLTGSLSEAMRSYLLHSFTLGVQQGRISVPSVETAVDMGMGMVIAMLRYAAMNGVDAAEIGRQTMIVFQALGVESALCEQLAQLPMPASLPGRLRAAVIAAGLR
jgi:AcrR family transcriptional regulator